MKSQEESTFQENLNRNLGSGLLELHKMPEAPSFTEEQIKQIIAFAKERLMYVICMPESCHQSICDKLPQSDFLFTTPDIIEKINTINPSDLTSLESVEQLKVYFTLMAAKNKSIQGETIKISHHISIEQASDIMQEVYQNISKEVPDAVFEHEDYELVSAPERSDEHEPAFLGELDGDTAITTLQRAAVLGNTLLGVGRVALDAVTGGMDALGTVACVAMNAVTNPEVQNAACAAADSAYEAGSAGIKAALHAGAACYNAAKAGQHAGQGVVNTGKACAAFYDAAKAAAAVASDQEPAAASDPDLHTAEAEERRDPHQEITDVMSRLSREESSSSSTRLTALTDLDPRVSAGARFLSGGNPALTGSLSRHLREEPHRER